MIASRQTSRRPTVARRRGAPSPGTSADAIIAYDNGATFKLTGRPGNIIEDVINITPDGTFVAVAIGYGFEEERGRPLALQNDASGSAPPLIPGNLTLGNIPASALIEGFRVNPRFEHLIFESPGETERALGRERVFLDEEVPIKVLTDDTRPTLFERLKTPEEISFFFSLIDSSTGRELQDEPTHNLASLGKSNGERPFRLLAQPITFAPRSTVRLQIIERTEGVTGTLFIVLYGYTILGTSVCPETVARRYTGPWQCPVETVGRPSDRVIPFDYVVPIQLSGRPKNLVENETIVNAEGGFVATAIGYGLLAEEPGLGVTEPGRINGEIDSSVTVPVALRDLRTGAMLLTLGTGLFELFLAPGNYQFTDSTGPTNVFATIQVDSGLVTEVGSVDGATILSVSPSSPPTGALKKVNLRDLTLRAFPPSALIDGIRIRPELVRLAFTDNAQLNDKLPIALLDELFEGLNRSEDVSFRYTIFDSGRGRELQNIPLHNVAGLGVANGDRPFKRLARPMVFLPRSTVRIQVEERFGRGKLFFVFQGYKILGPPTRRGRA